MPQLVGTVSPTDWYDTVVRTMLYLFVLSHRDTFLLQPVLVPQVGFQGREVMWEHHHHRYLRFTICDEALLF